MIKQAIILAAGMGKRLGHYTKDVTKCMVKVNGKSIIESSLEALTEAGINKIIVVVGYKADSLKAFLHERFPELNLVYILNEVYDKTNNIYSLWLAKEYLQNADTLLLESDLMFEPEIISEIINDEAPNLAVVSLFESWMDGTVTMLDENGDILSVIDKAGYEWNRLKEYYKTVNIYKFSKEFSNQYYLPFLEAYLKAFGTNEYYEQVLKVLASLKGANLKGYKVSGRRWYEVDDPHDLAIAETIFSDDNSKLEKIQSRYGGYWRFPGLLDYCYLVNPYYPPKRLIDEMKSMYLELMSMYPSGASVQSQLAGKSFNIDPSMIMAGNGAAELIAELFEHLGGNTLVQIPTFGEYTARVPARNLKILKSYRPDCSHTKEEILDAAKSVDNVVIVNPDNPSGFFFDKTEILVLIDELLDAGKNLIIDESFCDFVESSRRYTLIDEKYLSKRPGLYVIKSISKSYGVPGCRLGIMASGNKDIIKKMKTEIPVWNINSFGEFFLQIMDKYSKDFIKGCDQLATERKRFVTELKKLKMLEVFPSQANYVLCKLAGVDSFGLTKRLLNRHNIFIKDLSNKEGMPEGQYIRLAVRNEEDNNKLLRALQDSEK